MARSGHMSARSSKAASNRAIHADVDGAPFSIGQSVTVCGLADETAHRDRLSDRERSAVDISAWMARLDAAFGRCRMCPERAMDCPQLEDRATGMSK